MIRWPGAVVAALALAACTPRPGVAPPVAAAPGPPPPGVSASRAVDTAIAPAVLPALSDAAPALAAFRKSCPALLARDDRSGLSRAGDWTAPCAAAATPAAGADPARFFADQFTAIAVAGGAGFATGYYEPEIAASRTAAPGFATPLYRRPPDLVEADLGSFAADLTGRKLRGRLDGNRLVPYPDRAAIMAGALAGRGLELAFAADPYEAFFLEIQGSGRLRLPDGSIMRIGYDGQNGRDYVAIGKLLRERGELPAGGVSMDSILAWLHAHPAEAPALLAANPSAVFFCEIRGDGPVGAMGVAVTPRVSVAADPAFVPLGAPLLVSTTLAGNRPLTALMVAQDSGGAIKGPNRIDLFLGSGAEARRDAGAQASPARLILLLPRAAAARLLSR